MSRKDHSKLNEECRSKGTLPAIKIPIIRDIFCMKGSLFDQNSSIFFSLKRITYIKPFLNYHKICNLLI